MTNTAPSDPPVAPPADRPRLLFVVTEDWYFYSHRRPMILAAQQAGFDVGVVTNIDRHEAAITGLGVRVIPFSFARRSLNPLRALCQVWRLAKIYRAENPQIVHHIALKPIVLGGLAAWLARVPHAINAFAGLGYIFNARRFLAAVLRLALIPAFFLLLRRPNSWLLLQNSDDLATLRALGLVVPERARVIRGSGIDLTAYPPRPMAAPAPDFICVFAGRMIDIKGLPTLKDAFEILGKTDPRIRLLLYGRPDPANPGAWSEDRIQAWVAGCDNVAYEGHADDMAQVWASAHLALQPSYGGEGVPKSLLEAAASGRAIVASDVPGCREVVDQGRNGFLVPPYDALALARAIAKIAGDWPLCQSMGQASRRMVESDLSAEKVTALTAALYHDCVTGTEKTSK